MVSSAISFEYVSKHYRGPGEYRALRDDLVGAARRLTGRRGRHARGAVKALDDVSLEVPEGQAFGLIGPNGAGKTTLLKIATRIAYPTDGRVRVRGRVGALIEVGTGMHPELTGRENIRLYGRILGLTGSGIVRRFDDIVDFAGIGAAIDQPVKQYSSGMQLRLGFSVASHLDPDVLLVDEALAVGDAGFQAKCIERMTELVSDGRTLVLVSHNLSVVEAICRQGAFLLNGQVASEGTGREVVRTYLQWVDDGEQLRKQGKGAVEGGGLVVRNVTVHDDTGAERYTFDTGEAAEFRFHILAQSSIRRPWFSIGIGDGRPGALILCSMLEEEITFDLTPGQHILACRLTSLPLGPRTYDLHISVREENGAGDLVDWSPVGSLQIRMPEAGIGPAGISAPWMYGPIRVPFHWEQLC